MASRFEAWALGSETGTFGSGCCSWSLMLLTIMVKVSRVKPRVVVVLSANPRQLLGPEGPSLQLFFPYWLYRLGRAGDG